jgi:hypothetical protein
MENALCNQSRGEAGWFVSLYHTQPALQQQQQQQQQPKLAVFATFATKQAWLQGKHITKQTKQVRMTSIQ